MTGLSVLYASEAAKEPEWATIPGRLRTKRLREVYWARRAEPKPGGKRFVGMGLQLRTDRSEIGRRSDEPGDRFVYLVDMMPPVGQRFEWLEVTEVFTTVPASRIEGAMRAWNGIAGKQVVDFDEFRKGLRLGRPSRVEQRKAADRAIAQIERKLTKASYCELLEKYGYGTLVVGMPLWFATPPDVPFRAENALEDFTTRTGLGLEDIERRILRKPGCPFRKVIVTWDPTPQAMREWRERKSAGYEDATYASMDNAIGLSLLGVLSDSLEQAVSETGVPESEAPSFSLHFDVEAQKKASGKGPYPALVETLGKAVREQEIENPFGLRAMLKWKVALMLWKLLCFVRLHGVEGLERWIVRKFSVSHAWKERAIRRKMQRFHRESRRRDRIRDGAAAG